MEHLEKRRRKIHPKERTNFISNIFFFYALKLFKKGFKKDLEEKDLYEVLSDYRSDKLGDRLEQEWEKQKKSQKEVSTLHLIWSCYGLSYIFLGCMLLFINILTIIIEPYSLGKLIGYFAPGQTDLTKLHACFYATVIIGFNFFQCVYRNNYYLLISGFGIKVRTALCSFIYRKALKLSPVHSGDNYIGKIVTLITKDVEAFIAFVEFGNDIWIGVLRTIVASCILYNTIGLAALAAVGFFFIIIPLQIYLGGKLASLKTKMCEETDKRLQITQETLSAVRIIKIYTWEKFFETKISKARKNEIHTTFKIFVLTFAIIIIGSLNAYIAQYIMLISYIWLGNKITAEKVYFILTTFHSVSFDLGIIFPLAVNKTAELAAAIKRIGNIVKATEVQIVQLENDTTILPKIILKDVTLTLKNHIILHEINLKIEKGLTIITGPVGSGKSVFLKTILRDYQPEKGRLVVQGDISYASQAPWVFPSSIRQNILFGQKFNERRYREVLKICALIYDLELLEAGDGTIVEDRGSNLSRGQLARINLARAIYKKSSIYLLDDCLSALDAHVSAFIFKECIGTFLRDKLVVLVTHNMNYLKCADSTIILHNGRVKLTAKCPEINNDGLLDDIDNETEQASKIANRENGTNEETNLIPKKRVYQEDKKSGSVDFKVYKNYIDFGGGFIVLLMVFCVFISAQVTTSYSDKLVSNWVNMEEKFSNYTISNSSNTTVDNELEQERRTIFYIYSFMAIATTLTTLARSGALFLFVRRASIKLHKCIITTIVNGSLQFFDTNFIGNILNKFSKDLTVVDSTIPAELYYLFKVILNMIGIIALIASVNSLFLIPASIFILIVVILRKCFIPTGRSLKRLECLTRSPVVGHINATLEGLTTIRAFKAQKILRDEFDRHQDHYTSAVYLLMSSVRALAFALDFFGGLLIATIITRFLVFDYGTLAGDVGLAISQASMLTATLHWVIREWAQIEYEMTSMERLLEYTEIKQESKAGLVLEKWPKRGEIRYHNVNLSYTNSSDVLKNINFTVKPKEKIGIAGRTGAGKSSIVTTLFRLYEIKGTITIDHVDIKTLSLDFLRSSISMIPQDPVLFSGTIRDNIDPARIYRDEEIWDAIETANLKNLVQNLDFQIVEGGSNFSIGQRQLICLARALVGKSKIVILDEATANMDSETDELIHQTMKNSFVSCTVFTIAHKLDSILDSDKIMVLDKGEIVEYDEPANLLRNENGIFYKMVAKSGLLAKPK